MSCKMGNFMNLRVSLAWRPAASGCSGLSKSGISPSNPWKNEASQNIQMRYLAFQYQVIPVGNELGIVAEAYPVIDKLPDWASWYGEIMLSVYVSDEYGRVLASKDTVLVPRPLNREAGLPLEVSLDLGTNRHQPLSISFGYRLVLTDTQPDGTAGRRMLHRKGRSKIRRIGPLLALPAWELFSWVCFGMPLGTYTRLYGIFP